MRKISNWNYVTKKSVQKRWIDVRSQWPWSLNCNQPNLKNFRLGAPKILQEWNGQTLKALSVHFHSLMISMKDRWGRNQHLLSFYGMMMWRLTISSGLRVVYSPSQDGVTSTLLSFPGGGGKFITSTHKIRCPTDCWMSGHICSRCVRDGSDMQKYSIREKCDVDENVGPNAEDSVD